MSVTISFTLHLWWFVAYLLIGVVLFIPLAWALNRYVWPRPRLWGVLARNWRRIPVWIVAWPVSVLVLVEELVSAVRRRRRRRRHEAQLRYLFPEKVPTSELVGGE